MTDAPESRLTKATRELEQAVSRAIGMVRCDSSASVVGVDAAVAELVAAAREEGMAEALEDEKQYDIDMREELNKAAAAIKTSDKWDTRSWPSPVERAWYVAAKEHIAELEKQIAAARLAGIREGRLEQAKLTAEALKLGAIDAAAWAIMQYDRLRREGGK